MYQHEQIIRLLEEDAKAIAGAFSGDQKRAMGKHVPRTPENGGAWSDPNEQAVEAVPGFEWRGVWASRLRLTS